MKKETNDSKWIWVLAAAFVLVVLIAYLISLGTIDISKSNKLAPEFKESKEEAEKRNLQLKLSLDADIELKRKLEKKFWLIFFSVRIFLVTLWGLFLTLLWQIDVANDINDLLFYSELILIVLIILNFITFGTLVNLQDFLEIIRKRIENWVYRKHKDLDQRIKDNQLKLDFKNSGK